MNQPNLNSLPTYRLKEHGRETGVRYVPLPRDAWRSCGRCDCPECQGSEGFWDTLVVPFDGDTWTVHWPQLQTHRTPNALERVCTK